MATTRPEIIVREHDQPTRLFASGSLVDHGAEQFRGRLDDVVHRHGRVVIDLTGVCAIDETTLDALHAHRGSLVALLLPIDGPIDPATFGPPLEKVIAYKTSAHQATHMA